MLIDLGEMPPAVDEPAPPPVRALSARYRGRGRLLLLAVLAVLTVGAGAAPVDPLPRLFSATALGDAPILFSGDRMYAIDGPFVVAYSLRDGARLWRAPTSLPATTPPTRRPQASSRSTPEPGRGGGRCRAASSWPYRTWGRC
jgi:hypothetical protein